MDRSGVRNLVLARLVSSTGAEAAFFIGLWGKAAYELQGTVGDLALMSALISVAAITGSAVGGVLVDRLDGRRVAIGAEVLFVPATLALIWADTLPRLFATGVLVWVLGAVLETAITALPPVLVGTDGVGDDLDRANARLESANWLALVIGPAVGGLLFPTIGYAGIFVVDAVSSVLALGLVLAVRLPERAPRAADADGGAVRDLVAGLRYAVRTPPVRMVLLLLLLPSIGFGTFVALEPLFFRDVVGAPVEVLGYVNAVFGVGLFAGSMAVERLGRRISRFTVGVVVITASGIGSLAYVATGDLRVVLVGAVLWSVPLGIALPLVRTLAQRAAEPAYIGRVTGSISLVGEGAGLLPLTVAPALAAAFGVQAVLLGAGVLTALLAPLLWRAAARLDQQVPPLPPDHVVDRPPAATVVGPAIAGSIADPAVSEER